MNGASLPPGVLEQVTALVNQGKKINAIKVLRGATGWGLKESKEYIDAIALGNTPPAFPTFTQRNIRQEPTPEQSREPSPEVFQQIIDLNSSGKKIEAIKIYRLATGCSLREAKEYVETLKASPPPQGEQSSSPIHPTVSKPTSPSGSGSTHPHATSTGGCGSSVFLLAGFAIAVIWIMC